MKRVIAASLPASVVTIEMVGCTKQKSSTGQVVKSDIPGGTTTITTGKQVKKTGDNPPLATTP